MEIDDDRKPAKGKNGDKKGKKQEKKEPAKPKPPKTIEEAFELVNLLYNVSLHLYVKHCILQCTVID